MKTAQQVVSGILPLVASALSHASVSLVSEEATIHVIPGTTFSVTLNVSIDDGERVSGIDYFWRIDDATSGMFAIIGRDFAESLFSDPLFSNTAITELPASELAPQNGLVLGAVPENWEDYASTGIHFLATYTFSVSESVVGAFVLRTVSDPISGWSNTDFTSHDFDRHAAIIIHVGQVPEPETCSLFLGILAVAILILRVRPAFRMTHASPVNDATHLPDTSTISKPYPSMNTKMIKSAVAAICAAFPIVTTASAALIISDSGIVANSWSYDVTFDETTAANAALLFADMNEYSNIEAASTGSGTGQRNFIRAKAGASSAYFIYEFDFSGLTNYEATSIYLQDVAYLNNGTGAAHSIITSYKLGDTGDWITLNTVTNGQVSSSDTIPLTDAIDKVYYKVEFTSAVGTTFTTNNFQWNRSAPGATNTFQFTLNATPIPEPATTGIAILGAAAAIALVLKRQSPSHRRENPALASESN